MILSLAKQLLSNFAGVSYLSLNINNAVGLLGRLISFKIPHPNMCSVVHNGLFNLWLVAVFNLYLMSIRATPVREVCAEPMQNALLVLRA